MQLPPTILTYPLQSAPVQAGHLCQETKHGSPSACHQASEHSKIGESCHIRRWCCFANRRAPDCVHRVRTRTWLLAYSNISIRHDIHRRPHSTHPPLCNSSSVCHLARHHVSPHRLPCQQLRIISHRSVYTPTLNFACFPPTFLPPIKIALPTYPLRSRPHFQTIYQLIQQQIATGNLQHSHSDILPQDSQRHMPLSVSGPPPSVHPHTTASISTQHGNPSDLLPTMPI